MLKMKGLVIGLAVAAVISGKAFAGKTDMPESLVIQSLISNTDDNAVIETNGYIYVKAKYEMGGGDSIDTAKKGATAKAIELILGMKDQKAQHYTDIFKKMKAGESDASTFVFTSQNLVSLGVITEQKLLKTLEDKLKDREYSVIIKAVYQPIEGSGDPLFFIDASMSKSFYIENEAVQIRINVQKTGFLYVFSISDDGIVYPVYPHNYTKPGQNVIDAGKEFKLPTKEDMSKGINYIASIPVGQTSAYEYLKIIVADKANLFTGAKTYEDLNKWLTRLKRDEFEYVDLGYVIHKPK
ncbi:MAG: hypothetical protein A2Y33_01395 [Spirochaetes bacterium GWF1_51_8]|nr:MAG: hypothetical protein A2Y33_01395 [Spirochaetes bacterium GWF1_51_8]